MMEQTQKEIIHKLKPILKGKVKFAILYGSAGRGRLQEDSDIDLAVYLQDKFIPQKTRETLIQKIYKTLNREVDFIVLNESDIIITNQALATGIIFYDEDPNFTIQFKARKISEYIDFKQSRAIIEKTIMQKGWPQWNK